MSTIATFAYSAAAFVSPFSPCSNVAEKLVTCSMYSLADIPDVLYASFAYFFTISAFSLKSVSTPPTACSNAALSEKACFIAVPIPAAAITFLAALANDVPNLLP